MKKTFAILVLIFTIIACEKSEQIIQSEQEYATKPPPPPPPANANPVIAYSQTYSVSSTQSVPAIYVMDENGANQTVVYHNYTKQRGTVTSQTPDNASWSGDGTKLCFTLNSKDLYTLSISLVNGVATGSNATKIGDGVADGGTYKQGKWRPGFNQIASVWKKTGESDKIRLLASTGGMPSILYTVADAGWVLTDDIAFNPEGSKLLFSEKQLSTELVLLKVLDVNSGLVIYTSDMSQFRSIAGLDWSKTAGSNLVAIQAIPLCDNTTEGINQRHIVYTLDVNAEVPSLTYIATDRGNICWSPNDLKLLISTGHSRFCGGTGCCISNYFGMQYYNFDSQSYTFIQNLLGGSKNADWKR